MAITPSQEVELKFLIKNENIDSITAYLDTRGEVKDTLQIKNYYFDTVNKDFHQHKIGLRIRCWNDQSEQTIKMAGSQIGALSQRPEYNVPYRGSFPQLDLFPVDIWPATLNPSDLQAQLREQFQISFQRQRWLLPIGDSNIEVAIDQGYISAGTGEELAECEQETICELEAELLAGKITDLMRFADQLTNKFSLQTGYLSKAQRGFLLVDKS
ncbi:hypothetical protein CWE08_08805 [Aliidiomarina iranensis]|uniref:CYTH domain-containing protein n=1 Tax=Aliidiomarina iranensis TaxID=1434071 RepID=A0A432VU24_9GAMM|nr:CYTH domain-containing protein [Aliidiomarina iranensis]RUO20004.1 hypothetical protein CWE08_08805 [Aliidiomarina iranensis]